MKTLKLAAVIIILIGTAYISYGAIAIGAASFNVADLPPKMARYISSTGATWDEWKRTFFRGGIWGMGLGCVAIIAGIGVFRFKTWGRTLWLFLSPILLLNQFSEGQKSLTYFRTNSSYHMALGLLIIVTMSWLLLLTPTARRELAPKAQHRRRH